jgi:hypothetical protein
MPLGKTHHRKPYDIEQPVDVNITGSTIDFDCEVINPGSIIGNLTVPDTAPVEIKVSGTALADRHTVIVFNDSSYLIFVGFSPTMTPTEGVLINSGNNATFRLDKDGTMKLYALGFENTAIVKVMEVK